MSQAPARADSRRSTGGEWWRRAVIYQIYPRSFADASGDGEGDIAGMRARLPYLDDLGVDGIWISPWYPSPMADGGYDVSDFTRHPPAVRQHRGRRRRSSPRPATPACGCWWTSCPTTPPTSTRGFRRPSRAPPGSPERGMYFFRDGTGAGGDEPPNNWISCFGGSRLGAGDRGRRQARAVVPAHVRRRAARPRLDAARWCWTPSTTSCDSGSTAVSTGSGWTRRRPWARPTGCPDADYGGDLRFMTLDWVGNPHWDVDEVHEVFRRWRGAGRQLGGDRIFVAEAVVSSAERLSNYLRPDEMHSAFNFPYMKGSWDAERAAWGDRRHPRISWPESVRRRPGC